MQKFWGRSLAAATWLLTGLFGAVLVIASTYIYLEIRKASLVEIHNNVQQALPRATAAVNRMLLSIDTLLVTVAEQTQSELIRDPLSHREQLATLLRQMTRTSLVVREIAFFERNGALYRPAGTPLDDQDAVTLRRYAYDVTLNSAGSQLTISEPINHFQNADSVILIAKKITLRGDEHGVLVAVLPSAHVSAVMGSAAALPGSTIVLSNRDFNFLATFPDSLIPRPRGLLKDRHSTVAELLAVSGDPVAHSNEVAAAAKTLHDDTSITVRYSLDKISETNTRAFFWIIGVSATLFAIACLAAFAFLHSIARLRNSGTSVQRYALWLNEAFQAASYGLLLCDADNKIRVWNSRFVELFPDAKWALHDGLDFQTMLDTIQGANDASSTWQARKLMVSVLSASRSFSSSSHQTPIELAIGERNVISVQTAILSDGATVSTYVDVTEADTKLRKAQNEIRSEFSKRSLYLLEFSNRIAKPVNTIAGSVQRLNDRSDNTHDTQQSIDLIAASTNELLLIHAQILAFEKGLQERLSTSDTSTSSP